MLTAEGILVGFALGFVFGVTVSAGFRDFFSWRATKKRNKSRNNRF